jgi:hypothetical protein
VVAIAPVGEGDEEPGIGDALHERAKPFRAERSRGPRTVPASRRKAWRWLAALALSCA